MSYLLGVIIKSILAGVLLLIAGRLFRAFTDPLRSVPGPFLARLTRLWYLKAVNKGDFELENVRLHREHGRCCGS